MTRASREDENQLTRSHVLLLPVARKAKPVGHMYLAYRKILAYSVLRADATKYCVQNRYRRYETC